MLGKRVHHQIERSLRLKGIQVAETPCELSPALYDIGMLVLDVHVLEASDATAVAWSLQHRAALTCSRLPLPGARSSGTPAGA